MTDPTQDPSQDAQDALKRSDQRELEVVEIREGMFGVRDSGDTTGFGGLQRPIMMPGATNPPYGGWFDDVAERLIGLLDTDSATIENAANADEAIEKVVVDRGEITFFIRRHALLRTATHLRNDEALRFEFFSGVSGVHFPHEPGRELHAVYHLMSMTHNRRIRLEVVAPENDPYVPSVVSIYPTADWHERETWDMFGIVFDDHPALTRILMPDDWQGHPQRKDYPLGGIPVEYKGGTVPPPDERRAYN